jgi:hypothetical protein
VWWEAELPLPRMHTHTPDVLSYCAVDDMSSDLLIQVTTLTGQTDVLVSNTRTHPTRNSPAGAPTFTSSVAALLHLHASHPQLTRRFLLVLLELKYKY